MKFPRVSRSMSGLRIIQITSVSAAALIVVAGVVRGADAPATNAAPAFQQY